MPARWRTPPTLSELIKSADEHAIDSMIYYSDGVFLAEAFPDDAVKTGFITLWYFHAMDEANYLFFGKLQLQSQTLHFCYGRMYRDGGEFVLTMVPV
jgi:hypothetical protein